ncbi:hypothetical protein KSU1_C1495 [Candidatus Jettenia caeni]|uniref:Uncharacterized protein n=1 Tax=Candidatus Jettenia caeni TaxID=247490 RepID=I3IMZ6_9BACT|nr:hypothetical protein KSU1_C1495 [Candidatus Jettenia caeni]
MPEFKPLELFKLFELFFSSSNKKSPPGKISKPFGLSYTTFPCHLLADDFNIFLHDFLFQW